MSGNTNQSYSETSAYSETPDQHRFIIGIDLGTTNCAVSYVDLAVTGKDKPAIKIFNIPQLVAAGELGRSSVLPSFFYIPGEYDIDTQAIGHPWPTAQDAFAGILARDHGAQVPARLISSAKSWLCHGNVDRNAKILPWGAPEEMAKVSPVQASAAYLDHIRRAWNHTRGNEEELFLENQSIIITVPASFDEVARELTLSAAKMAGLADVTLIEEPLAAFYSWLIAHEDQWQQKVQPNELILICDVGGGTTDFTLVSLTEVEGGSPRFERIAVGDHLILGGDNIDLALARRVEAQWSGNRPALDTNRYKALCHQCRQAKEKILSGEVDSSRITLRGTGSRLIAGTISADLIRSVVEETIIEGFFPLVDKKNVMTPPQRPAITEFGLPYESEPAITSHMLRFLERHQADAAEALGKSVPMPDLILFNGGSLKPAIIQNRINDVLRHYFGEGDTQRPRVLENRNHDLAVALGAAYYGLVKLGRGVRVGSGSPRSYYLGVGRRNGAADQPEQAICLVERGLDEGSPLSLGDRSFDVLANQPVQFDLYSSSFRSRDHMGDVVSIDESMISLPPIQTVIQYGKKGQKANVPIEIQGEYTELGTLALWCHSQISDHRWQLQFQLRDAVLPQVVGEGTVLDADLTDATRQTVRNAFEGSDTAALNGIMKQLTAVIGLIKDDWPLSLLRDIADILIEKAVVRNQSLSHEIRWMNLLGFCMRPGFGDALDPQRLKQIWKLQHQGPLRPNNAQVQSEWYIMWRRLAGGLNPGQQRQLSQIFSPRLKPKKGGKVKLPPQQQLEIWMAAANLERLYTKDKYQLGRMLMDQMTPAQVKQQHFWSLARIGARELLYGPADRVIPATQVGEWIDRVIDTTWKEPRMAGPALAQMARRTGDRTRDLNDAMIERVMAWMTTHNQPAEQKRFLTEVVPVDSGEIQTLFGESLPSGIVLRED